MQEPHSTVTQPSQLRRVRPGLYRCASAQRGPDHPAVGYALRRDAQTTVLIDPPADLTPPQIEAADLPPVTDILITHLQAEHAAGVAHFPEARVHVPRGDAYLAGGAAAYRDVWEAWVAPWDWEHRGNFHGHLAGAFNERPPAQPIAIAGTFEPGERVLGFDVRATPGHGKHAVTLITDLAGERVAFCGDVVCNDGQLWSWFDCEWDYGPETGQRTLRDSAARFRDEKPDLLLPAHGEPIEAPDAALAALVQRLDAALAPISDGADDIDPQRHAPLEKPSAAPGFRELLPGLHQWCETPGNCAVLVSETGRALLIDDGLCTWKPLDERAAHHREVMQQLKQRLGIERIDTVLITHFHGDHIENIPDLVEMEACEVVTLDVVAGPVERPEDYNLACLLPWYGTRYRAVKVDRQLQDGDVLQWHEYQLKLFHLGGQTYYHAGIETTVADRRVVFVGDAIMSVDVNCAGVICYNDAEPATRGWAYALDHLIEREPDLLVSGHAGAIVDPMPVLQRKRANWNTRLAQLDALNARGDRRLFFDPFYGR
ncbi:MAG: MBL fold metallo-hydrolase [Phycisphaeraceae bacterium]